MKTIDNISVNKGLIWDYEFSEEEKKTPFFADWYLSRVLNNGNYSDIKEIPIELIKKKLNKLQLSRQIKKFWEWYFK